MGLGFGANGQLGNGSTEQRNSPVQVINLSNVKAIAAGEFHSMALLNDGTVRAWGQGIAVRQGTGSLRSLTLLLSRSVI